jgi:ketosteroid isomerase-like protein
VSDAAERNLTVMRRALAAMSSGSIEELRKLMLEVAHPEIEWSPLVTQVEGESYRGHDGLMRFFEDFIGAFTVRYEVEDLRALGDHGVLVLGHMNLSGQSSGAGVRIEMGALYEFEEGQLRCGRVYSSQAEAQAAAEALHA